jgi:acetoacetyl-CoA synthetase
MRSLVPAVWQRQYMADSAPTSRGVIIGEPESHAAPMWRFAADLSDRTGVQFDTYESLHRWSVANGDEFWRRLSNWFDIEWRTPPTNFLGSTAVGISRHWCSGARLNYVDTILRSARRAPQSVALVGLSQTRDRCEWTYEDLVRRVRARQLELRGLGIGSGSRVVSVMPNIPETVEIFLAAASLGALFSCCPPEFGVDAVAARLGQLEPDVMYVVDGYRHRGRDVSLGRRTDQLRRMLPSLRAVVGIEYLSGSIPRPPDSGLEDFDLESHACDFDDPLYVLYSSGTTGKPKALVHGHGGIVLEHHKALGLHHGLGDTDHFFWYTTTGWMMWNYLVSGLMLGTTVSVFDGDPAWPSLDTLFEKASSERWTVMGAGAPFWDSCMRERHRPGDRFDLGSLRVIGSTGAPLSAESSEYVCDMFDGQARIHSISGGTDVCTAFVGMNPMSPIRAGEIAGPMLGCAVEARRSDGSSCEFLEDGELVITAPMPSMPVALWTDCDGQLLHSTYYDAFRGAWRQGDWIRILDSGGALVISGRSDATMNRGGVRMGTAEFYAVLDAAPDVRDSLVVHLTRLAGRPCDLLVLVLATSAGSEAEVTSELCQIIRDRLSPRYVPDHVIVVPEIPRTKSGKRIELPVKLLMEGAPPHEVLEPSSLDKPASWASFLDTLTSNKKNVILS